MKKTLFFLVTGLLCLASVCYTEEKSLLIDDFEGEISGVPDGTVDYGAGNGSNIEVSASADIKQSGSQSIKVTYDAVPGGYMYVARGIELSAKKADWLVKPADIAWDKYEAISFYMYGANSGADVAFDIKDDGNEMWRFMVKDDFKGWKQMSCAFDAFYARDDWQPDNADKNGNLDFPLKSYQFEPRPETKGTLYFDAVALVEK